MSVVDVKITRQFAYANGRSFGDVGEYEQIDAVMTFGIDPNAPQNERIVDLEYAPRDNEGLVRFTADFSIVKPVDPERGSKRLLIELPNRGRRRVVDTFNRTDADPAASAAPGDGFLFERGLTVASIGWQWDVFQDDILMGLEAPIADLSQLSDPGQNVVEIRPNIEAKTWLLADRIHRPMKAADIDQQDAELHVRDYEDGEGTIIPRSEWSFAQETNGDVVPSDEHVYLNSGFLPGKYYQIIYTSKDAPIAGAGLIALRDATSFLKYDAEALIPGLGSLDIAIAYGVSQTGRMLRHFMYDGLNVDEQNRKVFEGLLPHVAGARRGAFNHRYAQPSNQSYPSFGHLAPYTDIESDDPISNQSAGLLSKLVELNAVPKVIYTNSSSEYWRGDCSLMHTNAVGTADVELGSESRMYHFAGTQHGAGILPQAHDAGAEGALALYATNVIDYSPLLRAALVNLENWIADGKEPPANAYARIDHESAASRGDVLKAFESLPDQVTMDPEKLWVMRQTDLGAGADEGVGTYPPEEGENYSCLVSAVDADGNEIAGVRLPDLTRPVATHTGWNPRHPDTGAPDQIVPMQGFTRWFPVSESDRANTNDVRPSINERYENRDQYAQLVKQDTEALAKAGYVLEQDAELVAQNALDRYDAAVARS
ncbi:MAG: hypothetical protein HOJ22_01290 [Chloroflexi bacterium]|jgi:hypothetical protein|nr:hypothetical protein [Chloroflexota bacterium]MBT5626902.1 hypothetical protein [Chloroflexota bacterium]